jgi:pimeloyl-ACP methyl ester carboxylesterase
MLNAGLGLRGGAGEAVAGEGESRTDPGVGAGSAGRRDSAARRWGRRIALAVAVLFVAATLSSWGYNAVTAGRANPPAGLRFMQAGPVRTRYLTWGTGGSPVVLVHGAFESAMTWEPTARLLAGTHRVYAFDLVGFGYSQRDGHYSLDDQVRQLVAFLAALGLDRPVLVGHSSGAAIAVEATLRAPDRVAGLMLLDGDALATGAGARSPVRHLLFDPYRTTLLRLALHSDTLIRRVYSQQCGPACAPLSAAGVTMWRRPFQVAGAEAALWRMLDQGVPGLDPGRLGQLARLPLPKSVVFGAEDDVFPSNSAARTAERIGAPPPTIVAGAHHLTMTSDPGAVVGAVNALAARMT